MDLPMLPGLAGASGPEGGKRLGRPKGAKNKRSSAELRGWIVAEYGGLTPGQQAAAIALVTAKEVRLARAEAKRLGIAPVVVAMMLKAKKLADFMGWNSRDAWAAMTKERENLLPYIHQRQPQAPEGPKGDAGRPLMVVADIGVTGQDARDLGGDGPEDDLQGFQLLSPPAQDQVTQIKSHGEAEPVEDQGVEPLPPTD